MTHKLTVTKLNIYVKLEPNSALVCVCVCVCSATDMQCHARNSSFCVTCTMLLQQSTTKKCEAQQDAAQSAAPGLRCRRKLPLPLNLALLLPLLGAAGCCSVPLAATATARGMVALNFARQCWALAEENVDVRMLTSSRGNSLERNTHSHRKLSNVWKVIFALELLFSSLSEVGFQTLFSYWRIFAQNFPRSCRAC